MFLSGVNGLIQGRRRAAITGSEAFRARPPPLENKQPRGDGLFKRMGETCVEPMMRGEDISLICRARSLLCGGVANGLESGGGGPRKLFSLLEAKSRKMTFIIIIVHDQNSKFQLALDI